MSKTLRIFLILIFSLSSQLSALSSKLLAQEKIVAIVNDDIITQKDLGDFMNFMKMQMSRQYRGKELEEKVQAMKLDLLNRLIDDCLILQEAKKEKIKIDEDRIKTRIAEIKKNYPSDAEFQADIAKQGLTLADIQKKLREQALIYNAIEVNVRRKIIVRPDEVTSFYNNNKDKFTTPSVRKFQTITLESEDLANSFAFELRSGQKLEDLAARFPITVDKLEVAESEELREDIAKVALKLNVGEISKPVNVNDKFVIFKLEDASTPRIQPLSEAQDRIQAFLLEQKSNEELKKWLDELKKKSYFKILQN